MVEQMLEDGRQRRLSPTKRVVSCPPVISIELKLKWGLTLLGEEKAKLYLDWIQARFRGDPQ